MVSDLRLTSGDRQKLNGEQGPAVEMAMSIIVQMADVLGAGRLMDITAAHIDSTLYMGDATLEYAERLAELGARVVVPTTLNVSGVDQHHWQEWPVPADWARKAERQMKAYQRMGTLPTWTCAPYQSEHRPRFGQQIAWGESNAIVFANSVIGARTERYPDLLDICAAITGRVPAVGLHLKENRAGQILFELREVPPAVQNSEMFYPVLGTILGERAGDQVPVVEGMEARPTDNQLKALGAAAASAGAVALFHIIGLTPEAPTREEAFQGKDPREVIPVSMGDLTAVREDLSSGAGGDLHMVALGCPHFSLQEFRKLRQLVEGKRCHPDVKFVVTTNRAMLARAGQEGLVHDLERFGATFTVDTCILTTPMLPESVSQLMTNSGKYAYYAPGLLGRNTVFGSLEDCVQSAVKGKVTRVEGAWEEAGGW